MAHGDITIKIPGELQAADVNGRVASAEGIYDYLKNKSQEEINSETGTEVASLKEQVEDTYRKEDVYNKEEINNMVSPDVLYVTVPNYESLPQPGTAKTIYRVANWNGSEVTPSAWAEYSWSNNEYVLLDVKEYGFDEEPTPDSENLMKSGDLAKFYGHNVDSPEYAYVMTDAEDKVLWGIQEDGNVFYGAGVPQQVKDYINAKLSELSLDEYESIVAFLDGLLGTDTTLKTMLDAKADKSYIATELPKKVDKEKGKSLIDEEVAESVSVVDNPEWLKVTTDAEGKILEGITTEGKKKVMVETSFERGIEGLDSAIDEAISKDFTNKSTLDKFSESNDKLLWDGSPIASETSISTLVVDLPISDGTGIESGYAYIDITDRTIKVKA